jgi:hypothetical protein
VAGSNWRGPMSIPKSTSRISDPNSKHGLEWPEKIVIAAAISFALVMFSIWALLVQLAGSPHDVRLNNAALRWFEDGEIIGLSVLWLVLRVACLMGRLWRGRYYSKTASLPKSNAMHFGRRRHEDDNYGSQ